MSTMRYIKAMRLPEGLPLIVSVTGHQNVPQSEVARIRATIRRFLNNLQNEYPDTGEIIVLTALARGVDRYAADEAIKAGYTHIFVLAPGWTDADVEKDGTSADALEFRRLREGSRGLFQATSGKELEGKDRFSQLGYFLAKSSHIMLAVWDGGYDSITSDTIHYAFDLEFHANQATDPATMFNDLVPTFAIPLRDTDLNKGNAVQGSARMEGVWILPSVSFQPSAPRGSNFWETDFEHWQLLKKTRPFLVKSDENFFSSSVFHDSVHDQIITRTNQCNRKISKQNLEEIEESAERLLPDREAALLPVGLQRLRLIFAKVDSVATVLAEEMNGVRRLGPYSNPRSKRNFGRVHLVFVGAWISLFCFELYAHLWKDLHLLLLSYPLLYIVALAFFRVGRRREDEILHYRTLAEALRVQFYCNLGHADWRVSDLLVLTQQPEMAWLRSCTRPWDLILANTQPVAGNHSDWIREYWIRGQAKYFARRSGEYERKQKQLVNTANAMLGLSLAIALALAFGQWKEWVKEERTWWNVPVPHFAITLIGTALVTSAVLHVFLAKRGYETLIRKYEWMHKLFQSADQALEANSHEKFQADLLHHLGRDALLENANWHLVNLDNPLEVPS